MREKIEMLEHHAHLLAVLIDVDFYDKQDKTFREPDNDVVVLKETGKILNLSTFILDYLPERKPKSLKF